MTEHDRLDAVAADYHQDGFEGLMTHASAEGMARLARGSRCLEIGAAVGITTTYLAPHFESVVVIEPAARYAAMLRDVRLPNVTVVESLLEDFVTEQTFDTIVMAHLLEHVIDPQGLLDTAAKLLADDGVILVAVPNAGSLHRHVGVLLGMLGALTDLTPADVSIGHRRVYELGTLRADIEAAGLRIESIEGQFCKPLSNTQMQQLPLQTQRAFLELGAALPDEFGSELLAVCRH
jgi:2-polyprenyl-3-methyl-5-hydroxy-6-metoxy-1,4-benzoquinol methylase